MVSLELEARLDNLLSTAQAETAHIDLFAPLPEREECPICMIPLPFKEGEIVFKLCCGKMICVGCVHKSLNTDRKNGVPDHKLKCVFCQQKLISISNNNIKLIKKLMKKKNPEAFIAMAGSYRIGKEGVIQSDTRSLEMYICSAELGHARAYAKVASYYKEGIAVEQDMSKAREFWEVAAKKGSVAAHEQLMLFHSENGNSDECYQHMTILASAGDQRSIDGLMKAYKEKSISKEELTKTLHAFQKSINDMKSKDRDDSRVTRELLQEKNINSN